MFHILVEYTNITDQTWSKHAINDNGDSNRNDKYDNSSIYMHVSNLRVPCAYVYGGGACGDGGGDVCVC